jgi:hypothetical protein
MNGGAAMLPAHDARGGLVTFQVDGHTPTREPINHSAMAQLMD